MSSIGWVELAAILPRGRSLPGQRQPIGHASLAFVTCVVRADLVAELSEHLSQRMRPAARRGRRLAGLRPMVLCAWGGLHAIPATTSPSLHQ